MSTALTALLLDTLGRRWRRWLVAALAAAFGLAFAIALGSSHQPRVRITPAAAPRSPVATPPAAAVPRHVAPLPGPRFAVARHRHRVVPIAAPVAVTTPTEPITTPAAATTTQPATQPTTTPQPAPTPPPAPAPRPKTFDSSGSQTFDSSG